MSARWGQVAPRSWALHSLHSHCFHCASPCELPQWAEQKFSWKTYDVGSFTEKATTKKQVKKRKEKQRTKGIEKNQTRSEIAGTWISPLPLEKLGRAMERNNEIAEVVPTTTISMRLKYPMIRHNHQGTGGDTGSCHGAFAASKKGAQPLAKEVGWLTLLVKKCIYNM